MRWVVLLVALSGCHKLLDLDDLHVTSGSNDGGTDSRDSTPGVGFRRMITIDAPGPAALIDFPVFIELKADSGLQQHAKANGGDIYFESSNDSTLEFEITDWRPGFGTLQAWVKIPTLFPGLNIIELRYGGTDFTHDASATWSSYAGVWHFERTGDLEQDSTGHGNDVASSGTARPPTAVGIAAAGRRYDGVEDSMCATGPNPTLDFGTGSFTYSAWVNTAITAGCCGMPVFKGGANSAAPGFDFELGDNPWQANVADGSTKLQLAFAPVTGTWTHIAAILDRSASRYSVLVDGVVVTSVVLGTFNSVSAAARPICFGSNGTANFFTGTLDEVRVSQQALLPQWHLTEVQLMKTPSLITIGDEQPL